MLEAAGIRSAEEAPRADTRRTGLACRAVPTETVDATKTKDFVAAATAEAPFLTRVRLGHQHGQTNGEGALIETYRGRVSLY